MVASIHGHDVMQMMATSGKTYTKESLKQEIDETFGPDARFYTCSAQDMDATALIEFLETKGKFIASVDGFHTSQDKICDH